MIKSVTFYKDYDNAVANDNDYNDYNDNNNNKIIIVIFE